MISSSSDGRVRRAIASEVVNLGIILSPVKPKTQKLVFTVSLFDAQHYKNCTSNVGDDNFFKPKTLENFEQVVVSASVLTFQKKQFWFKFRFSKIWISRCQFQFEFPKFPLKPGFQV